MAPPAPLVCPGCQSAMRVLQLDEAEVDYCTFCGGAWFDPGEVAAVVGNPLQTTHSGRGSVRRCVRCEETMVGAFLGVVAVDECPGCKGLYLDQGEIDTVAERVLNLGARAWQTTKALTSTCVGCRSTFRLGDLMTTAQGLACRQCFFAVDGGSSTILAPVAQRTTGGLLGSGSTRTLDSAAIGLLTILGG